MVRMAERGADRCAEAFLGGVWKPYNIRKAGVGQFNNSKNIFTNRPAFQGVFD